MLNYTKHPILLPTSRLSLVGRFVFHALAFLAALIWLQCSAFSAQEVITAMPVEVDGANSASKNAARTEQQFQAGLRAADAMMTARMPREAAKAYARLCLQFGDSPELFTRRFIAQVQSRDFPQATMVVALSQLMEMPIGLTDKPSESRRVLDQFVGNGVAVQASTEWIARKASSRLDDKDSLSAISAWMLLCGDLEKSALFERRAGQLQPTSAILIDSPPEGLQEEVVSEEVVSEATYQHGRPIHEGPIGNPMPGFGPLPGEVIELSGEVIELSGEQIHAPVEIAQDVIVLEAPVKEADNASNPNSDAEVPAGKASSSGKNSESASKAANSKTTSDGAEIPAPPKVAKPRLELQGGSP